MTERKPRLRLTYPNFRYVKSEATNLRKIFARVRARLRREAKKAKMQNGNAK